MTNIDGIVVFFIIAAIAVYGSLICINTVSLEEMGDLVYFYEKQTDNSSFDTDTTLNFELQRISEQHDATLNVEFIGNGSQTITTIDGVYIGALSCSSPCTLIVDHSLLSVSTNISFDINPNKAITVSETNLTYFRYDNCDYGEAACLALNSTTKNVDVLYTVLSFVLIVFAAIIVISSIR